MELDQFLKQGEHAKETLTREVAESVEKIVKDFESRGYSVSVQWVHDTVEINLFKPAPVDNVEIQFVVDKHCGVVHTLNDAKDEVAPDGPVQRHVPPDVPSESWHGSPER